MGNSASNYHNETPENFAFFHTHNAIYRSDYGIFNSTGQLLKGHKRFEQYTELATQLDTKRSAFYLESNGKSEMTFGCSLSVKVDNGREERVVFIQAYKNLPLKDEINCNIQLLEQFYERIKFEIENFELKRYRLIGLWEEEDFRNLREILVEDDFLEYAAGKVHAGKKVSVKILELGSGLSLVLKLINRLRHKFAFVFDVSQYPSESDISISLIKPNPDYMIGENGIFQKFTKPELWNFYKELGEEFLKSKNSYSNESQTRPDYINSVIKKVLHEPFYYCSSSNPIWDDSNDRERIEIFQGLIQKTDNINDINIRKALINIYHKTESPDCRKDLHKTLISKRIYIEELIRDLIITIHRDHNKELFNLLFSNNASSGNFFANSPDDARVQNKSGNDPRYNSFEKGIINALKELQYSDKTNFLKFIVNEAPRKPKTEGKILLKNLIEDMVKLKGNNNFILKLTEEETETLDKILDTNFLSTKKKIERKKRNKNIKTVIYTGALFTIILISCFFILHPDPAGTRGENNSSDDNTESNLILKFWEDVKGTYENRSQNTLDNVVTSDNKQETMQSSTKNETQDKNIEETKKEEAKNNESAQSG